MATNAIKTQGTVFKRGDGGGPEVFTAVGEVKSFSGPSGSAAVIDVTHFASTAKEKIMGLPDEGQITLGLNLVPGDAEQVGLRADRTGAALRNFELILADGASTKLSFAAYVLDFPIDGQPDGSVDLSVTLEISGPVTWS